MNNTEAAAKIRAAIKSVEESLEALDAAGENIPAVERNVKRLKGTLRALEVQFGFIPSPGGK